MGSPRFLVDLDAGAPRSLTPERLSRLASRLNGTGASVLPASPITLAALSTGFLSRLNATAHKLPVYASQPGLPPNHATLGSGWWLAFAGQDWVPARSHRRFQLACFLLLQALPGAP